MDTASLQGTPRPYLPPLLFVALFFWFGIIIAIKMAPTFGENICLVLAFCGLLLLTIVLLLVYLGFRASMSWICIGFLLGLTAGFSVSIIDMKNQGMVSFQEETAYTFVMLEDVKEADYGYSSLAKTILPNGNQIKVRIYFSMDDVDLGYGDIVTSDTKLKVLSETNFDYNWEQGIAATATIHEFEIHERSDLFASLSGFRANALSLLKHYDSDGASFLKAILFGERKELYLSQLYDHIKVVGLAHMAAVSGAHLVIVTSCITALLLRLRIPRKAIIPTQLAFIGFYLICVGLPISALRAACMSCVSLTSFFAKRSSVSINALALCVLVLLMIDVHAAFSLSFILSVGSTLGIVIFVPLIKKWCHHILGHRLAFVTDPLSLTLSSQVTTLPVAAAYFSYISLVSPLANIIAAPLFVVFCAGGLFVVLVSLAVPILGELLLGFMVGASDLFCALIQLLAAIPYAALPWSISTVEALLAVSAASFFLYRIWPLPRKRISRKNVVAATLCSIALLAVFFGFSRSSGDEIIMLDVGQGDSFVVRSQGATMLIDTGNQDKLLLSALGSYGIYHLDAVLITHADDDHYGSLESLKGIVQVDRVFVASDALWCGCASCDMLISDACNLVGPENIVGLCAEDKIGIGNFTFEVIWPGEFLDEGGNADSLTGLLTSDINSDGIPEWTALFCGDLEHEQLHTLFEQEALGDIDIYKVGHHGSKAALDDETAHMLNPEIALISAGVNNRYGHPSQEILDLLKELDCAVFRTDESGSVMCKVYQDKLDVTTLR